MHYRNVSTPAAP